MVSPSNMMAANDNPGRRGFPNLSRPHGAKPYDYPEVDEQVRTEVTEAGLTIEPFHLTPEGEVPVTLFVHGYRWTFNRRWYYWSATGPGIPPKEAEEFDKEWGSQVRVNGDCAARGAKFWGEGFAIGDYHIDTQEGLNAFVQLLKSIHKPRPE